MIARVRAELGFLVHDLHNIDPHSVLVTALGTHRLGDGSLIGFSLYMFFNRAYPAHPMPQLLEALKITQTQSISSRRMALAILIATSVGSVVIFWLLLDSYFDMEQNRVIMKLGPSVLDEVSIDNLKGG